MARDRRRLVCSAESVERGESLIGTASRVRKWVVVEQPGAWGHEALLESDLDPIVARALTARGRRHRARVVLARRPGWRPAADGRSVFLARTDPSGTWIERLDVPSDGDLLSVDFAALDATTAPGVGMPGPPSLHLVCTNGRHDQCCANLGRPVIRALDAAGTPDVWESAHVGGDRFAANVVCLPWGVYFGRVRPDDAARLLADYAAGLIDLDHYRGRSCYPPLVQAAEAYARRHADERRLAAVTLGRVKRHGDDEATATFELDGAAGPVTVRVRRVQLPPQHLTCTDHGTSQPWRYDLVDLSG